MTGRQETRRTTRSVSSKTKGRPETKSVGRPWTEVGEEDKRGRGRDLKVVKDGDEEAVFFVL